MIKIVASLCSALVLFATDSADAYHNGDFATSVSRGGGNGMYFTGSPRGKRLDCTACHALAARAIGIELSSDPPELIAESRWSPGQTYTITVTMTGEYLGDPSSSTSGYDNNSFVAELNDDSGRLVGSWAGDDPERVFTMDAAGGDPRIVGGYDGKGGTEWTVELTAPDAGAGRLTLYIGAVDGNAAGGGIATVVDPFGDDVFAGAWRFCEGNQSCDTTVPEPSEDEIDKAHTSPARGCDSGGGAGLLLAFVGLLVALRRRFGVVAIALLAGCLDSGGEPILAECPNDICEYTSEGEEFGTNPQLDTRFFECEVQPILQARCSNLACHGDEERPYQVFAPFRLRLDGSNDGENPEGTTANEFAGNRDLAREFARDDDPASSLLLLKPLDSTAGGYYHFGQSLYYQSDVFETTDDIGYQKILEWINGATASTDCAPTTEVGP